jgi:hypothetical protein
MIEFSEKLDSDDTVKLLPGDQGFEFRAGMMRHERAAMVIHPDCPEQVRDIVMDASNRGWLKPVAYMKQEEWAWARMSGDQ